MIIRKSKAAVALAALIAAALPVASHAADNPALDRCVEMFVKEVVPADFPAQIRRDHIVASIERINAARSRVMLIAQGEKDGKLFGRAKCVIHRDGSLVSMYVYDTKAGQPAYGRPKLLARNVDATRDTRTAFTDDTKPF